MLFPTSLPQTLFYSKERAKEGWGMVAGPGFKADLSPHDMNNLRTGGDIKTSAVLLAFFA